MSSLTSYYLRIPRETSRAPAPWIHLGAASETAFTFHPYRDGELPIPGPVTNRSQWLSLIYQAEMILDDRSYPVDPRGLLDLVDSKPVRRFMPGGLP